MRMFRKFPFTYCLPDTTNARYQELGSADWRRHGGRWVVFNRQSRVQEWVARLEPYVDSGEVREMKFYSGFRGDPSALIVYTLDREKEEAWRLLERLGVQGRRLWEYEREMKGLRYKAWTILRSMVGR